MFFEVEPKPGDPILALMAAYRADESPDKVDLGVGVYQEDDGSTPVLQAVRLAESRIYQQQKTKSYVGIAGDEAFNSAMTGVLLSEQHPVVQEGRVVTVQTAGGSGGLRVAAELLMSLRPDQQVWVTTPTWPNHRPLLEAAGVRIREFRYYDPLSGDIDRAAMFEDLERIPEGDIVLLHGCCHNPTGADLNQDDWRRVADICLDRNLLPFVDIAYQGFGVGLEEDVAGLRMLAQAVPEMVIVASCSKNFGLYRERTGSLSVIARQASDAAATRTHILKIVRAMISMPPDHGANCVATILGDEALTELWLDELTSMRERMTAQRKLFVDALAKHGLSERFEFIARQRGMFSLLGIDKAQIDHLREHSHVYVVGSSRINVAGLTQAKCSYIADALAESLSAIA